MKPNTRQPRSRVEPRAGSYEPPAPPDFTPPNHMRYENTTRIATRRMDLVLAVLIVAEIGFVVRLFCKLFI